MSFFPGHALRERREMRGLTLAQVYEHIRVPIEHIQALEEGRMDDLPGRIYATGFLNSYCQLLGLEPEPYLDRFRRCLQANAPAAPQRAFSAAVKEIPKARPVWMEEAIAWGAICAILLLGWLTWAAIVHPVTDNAGTRVEAGTMDVPQQSSIDDNF